MQKTIFLVSISLLVLWSAVAAPGRALAMESPPPALNPEQAVILKQALDILAAVLSQVQVRLANPTNIAPSAVEISAALVEVQRHLVLIASTLASQSVAIAPVPEPVAETPVVRPEQQQEETVSREAIPPVLSITDEERTGAAVQSVAGDKTSIGVVVGAALVLGIVIFFWFRRKEEPMPARQSTRPKMPAPRAENIPERNFETELLSSPPDTP